MTVVAGIDEAGYGPWLGPLVVAAAAYRLADGTRETALDRLVANPTVAERGLPTEDSKRLYHSGTSVARLETSALGHVALLRGAVPERAADLLALSVDTPARAWDELPWYRSRLAERPLPLAADPHELARRTAWQARRLARSGLTLVGLLSAPVPVPRFNRHARAAGSKAATLFSCAARLIEALLQRFPDDELIVHVDRQGGRTHYGDLLAMSLPFAPIETLEEGSVRSRYRLQRPAGPPVWIDFRVKADTFSAPVALASILAKTTREVCMDVLNTWFAEQRQALRPTAGYGDDGQRFAAEVAELCAAQGIDREWLVRCR